MYSIVLTDGKIINVNTTELEWIEKSRTIRIFNNRKVVARINMDNIVGWIDSNYGYTKTDKLIKIVKNLVGMKE